MATEIIDVLANTVATFTVNAAAQQAAMNDALSVVAKANGDNVFAAVDNVTLLAMGLNLPYQYCQGEGLASVYVEWIDEGLTETPVPIYFGFLPILNGAFSFGPNGLYSVNPQATQWPTKQSVIRMGVGGGNVSMAYTPPLIPNATVLDVKGWIQCRHLLPIEAP